MLRYFKTYPVSFLFILVVVYLSFFKPPSTELSRIPHFDKIVHFGMYFMMSLLLWWEFLRARKRDNRPMWHAWIGATACPILFSGGVELLQQYATTYRGGDWLDFLANSLGVLVASTVGRWLVDKLVVKG